MKGTGIDTRVNPSDPTQAQWRPKGGGDWVNFSKGGGIIQQFNFTASRSPQTFTITKPVSNPKALVVITNSSISALSNGKVGSGSVAVTVSVSNNRVTLSATSKEVGFDGGYISVNHSGYVAIVEGT